jgi:hypothetical protein
MLLPPSPVQQTAGVGVVRKASKTMHLENGRDIFRGILILIFAAIAFWGDLTIGLVLVAFMGVMILQSAFTDWCPADLFLHLLGLKRKLESKG